jgi:hypothetical protein
VKLREELKQLDANIKKMKKIVRAFDFIRITPVILASQTKQSQAATAAAANAALAANAESRASSGSALFTVGNFGSGGAGGDTLPILPMPRRGVPHLQSARLIGLSPNAYDPNPPQLSKTLVRKMHCLLRELGLGETLIASRAVCDLHDQVNSLGVLGLTIDSHGSTGSKGCRFAAVSEVRDCEEGERNCLHFNDGNSR